MESFDAIIIGTGQAGFPLASTLAGRGWKVAIAEGGRIGGSCINVGCSPTKTIVASARAAHIARRGADYGVQTGSIDIDFAKVMARKDAIVNQFHDGVESSLLDNDNITLCRGYASFEGPNTVRVGDGLLRAPRIYINTGLRPTVPSISGLDAVDYLDYVTILGLEEAPRELVIIGGGYVAVEYSQAMQRLGSQVTIIARNPHLLKREDADVAEAVGGILEDNGVRVLYEANTTHVEKKHADTILLTVEQGDETHTIEATHLMMATGRQPNSDRLNLDAAGIEADERGYIQVDDHLQTNVEGVYALGDVNGQGAFTHTSYNDYEIIVDNLDGGSRAVSDRHLIYAVYLDPPLGRVGMTEADVRADGRKALIGVKPMSHIARAIERDETQGFIKVLVDAETERFLGASILGIEGDEIIHTFADLMYADAPYTVMQRAVHIHPTVSELLPTLLGELQPLD